MQVKSGGLVIGLWAALLLVPCGLAWAEESASGLRFDGVYQSDPPVIDSSDTQHFQNLRFMTDGTVRRKESIDGIDFNAMARRMTPDNQYVKVGSYVLTGQKLTLDFILGEVPDGKPMTLQAGGELLPDGSVRLEELTTVYGHEYREIRRYFFHAVPGL